MNNSNICTATIKNFYHEVRFANVRTNAQRIEAINNDLKVLVKSGEWKHSDYFGFDSNVIKKIISLTYVSGINKLERLYDKYFGGDINVKLVFEFVNVID